MQMLQSQHAKSMHVFKSVVGKSVLKCMCHNHQIFQELKLANCQEIKKNTNKKTDFSFLYDVS